MGSMAATRRELVMKAIVLMSLLATAMSFGFTPSTTSSFAGLQLRAVHRFALRGFTNVALRLSDPSPPGLLQMQMQQGDVVRGDGEDNGGGNEAEIRTEGDRNGAEPSPLRLFFDVDVGGDKAGRLVFKMGSSMPKTVENVRQLATGERASIDTMCSYKGCQFEYNREIRQTISYRSMHIVPGLCFFPLLLLKVLRYCTLHF
jgi:hypothetical protein